jgi:DNA-binding NarL/FixJ family response regulator
VLLRGFASILESRGFEIAGSYSGGDLGALFALTARPDLILLDITAGLTFGSLVDLHGRAPDAPVVLWADSLPLDLIFKTLEQGVRGIVPRTSRPDQLAESLHRVASGEMHIGFSGQAPTGPARHHVSLTPREREIVMHLRQGLKNKQIATEMNITEGTVKIYLFRLFHKLGVRNRFELARSGGSNLSPFGSGNLESVPTMSSMH